MRELRVSLFVDMYELEFLCGLTLHHTRIVAITSANILHALQTPRSTIIRLRYITILLLLLFEKRRDMCAQRLLFAINDVILN